jgi:hypothetical protein
VKYVILIYHNPAARQLWDGLSSADRTEGLAAYEALNEDLAASGEMVVSHALADPSTAKRVLVKEGRTMTTDGPFAEVKEHLAGFYLIDVEDLEQAIAWAAKLPDAALNQVEVRPVLDMSGWEF